jgi:hypothetical protein
MEETMVRQRGRSWFERCALFGVLGPVLITIGFFTSPGGQPGDKASGQQVLAWYAAHHAREQLTNHIVGIGVVFMIFFFGMLIRWNGTQALWASLTGLAGFIIAASGFAFSGGVDGMLVNNYNIYTAPTAQTLNVFNQDFFLPVVVGLAVAVIGYGIAFLISHVLPKWVGVVGIVLGIGITLPGAASFFALLAIIVWVLMVSIWLFVKRRPTPVMQTLTPDEVSA